MKIKIYQDIMRDRRLIIAHKQITIDGAFNWWLWVLRFAEKTDSKRNDGIHKDHCSDKRAFIYVEKEERVYYIDTFEGFFNYIKRNKKVRIL